MQKTLGIRHSFIIDKSLRQAQNYGMAALESIYARLADVEQKIKTGEIEDLLALDLLVVELCG
jgi:DNA polymerase III delta subunit